MKRVLLKISGDALKGSKDYGYSKDMLLQTAKDIYKLQQTGLEVAVVVGGGNIFRGVSGSKETGIKRVNSDYMGMLATMMNAIALSDVLEFIGAKSRVLSSFQLTPVAEQYSFKRANHLLSKGSIVVFGGGTGNPFFTTDTASVLRASEIGADLLLKGTKVDGIYDKDPMKFDDAVMYDKITYDEALAKELKVMDLTAFALASNNNIKIKVYNMLIEGALFDAVAGKIGTLVCEEIWFMMSLEK